jgi:proline dehydrogenase
MAPEARELQAYAAIASHDQDIINFARAYAYGQDLPKDAFEFQMLYGIRRELQTALVRHGYTVRIYVPYGTHWYPYFMRRLAERPANLTFFLRALSGLVPGWPGIVQFLGPVDRATDVGFQLTGH